MKKNLVLNSSYEEDCYLAMLVSTVDKLNPHIVCYFMPEFLNTAYTRILLTSGVVVRLGS